MKFEQFKGEKEVDLFNVRGGAPQETTIGGSSAPNSQGKKDKIDLDTPGDADWDDPFYTSKVNGKEVDYWRESAFSA